MALNTLDQFQELLRTATTAVDVNLFEPDMRRIQSIFTEFCSLHNVNLFRFTIRISLGTLYFISDNGDLKQSNWRELNVIYCQYAGSASIDLASDYDLLNYLKTANIYVNPDDNLSQVDTSKIIGVMTPYSIDVTDDYTDLMGDVDRLIPPTQLRTLILPFEYDSIGVVYRQYPNVTELGISFSTVDTTEPVTATSYIKKLDEVRKFVPLSVRLWIYDYADVYTKTVQKYFEKYNVDFIDVEYPEDPEEYGM
jgi:hypothetical protein